MKKLLFLLAPAAPVLLSTMAYAADASDVSGTHDWSGVYLVGSFGGVLQNTDFYEDYYNHSFSDENRGAFFGAGLGYNVQQDSLVFGLEADLSFMNGATSEFVNTGDYLPVDENWAAESNISMLGTLRGRLGYSVDNVLIFLTGGLAYAKVHNSSSWPFYSDTSYDTNKKSWDVGLLIGAGAEVAVSERWSLRAEGFYLDLGNSKNDDQQGFIYDFDNTAIIGKVSAAFKF